MFFLGYHIELVPISSCHPSVRQNQWLLSPPGRASAKRLIVSHSAIHPIQMSIRIFLL